MKNKQELLAKHAQELAELEREEAIRAMLPEKYRVDALICIHGEFATVRLWDDYHTNKTLAETVEVVETFKDQVVQGEHWKDSYVLTWPAEINSCAKNAGATMDGSHEVEISVSGGRGFGPNVNVEFWIKTQHGLVEISCPVCDLFKLVPHVRANYGTRGDLTSCDISWPAERAVVDSFRTWWSEKPAYKGSYYLADVPNFLSWASNHSTRAKV